MELAKIKVLLVDDDSRLRASLVRQFEEAGLNVSAAISSAEARAFLSRESFDAILCDNQMAGTNGTRFLAEVRKEFPDVKRFMLSGDISQTQAFLVEKEIGVCGLFEKPCSAKKLVEAIVEAVEG